MFVRVDLLELPITYRAASPGTQLLACALGLLLGLGCGAHVAPEPRQVSNAPVPADSVAPAEAPAPPRPPSGGSSPSPLPEPDESCSPFECNWFDNGAAALGFVLSEDPLALGVGEAHALAGTEQLASTARRFSDELLPSLQGRASHLVVELLNPNPSCEAATHEVRKAQEPVTAPQSKHNQLDYVELGTHARALGIEPFVLSPTCDEFRAIASAGPLAIDVMLTTIARVTSRMLRGALARNAAARSSALVIGYGGALHNDIMPAEEKQDWSYGPDLETFTRGRYVELDLIVREFIKDTDAWRGLPWYGHFDPERNASRWLVMRTAAHRYALFFPKADAPR